MKRRFEMTITTYDECGDVSHNKTYQIESFEIHPDALEITTAEDAFRRFERTGRFSFSGCGYCESMDDLRSDAA